MEEIREGDVFRWHYREGANSYHCKSHIAIAQANGRLYDTYWGTRSADDLSFSFEAARRDLDLHLLGNLADFEKREEWEADYYAAADCLNLNHSNLPKGHFYIRKGATRSRDKMIEVALYKATEAERIVQFETDRAEKFRRILSELRAGRDPSVVWL